MTRIRFISKRDGTAIATETVREWFFESAAGAEVGFDVEQVWRQALDGDEDYWNLIEAVCEVEIIRDHAGFGFHQ
jgi:hypothetical protein